MEQTNSLLLHHQQFMLAVRRELGWPAFKPMNDCLAFCAGREMDFEVGSEMARIAQMLGKDAIYTGWANAKATKPVGFTIVYRERLTVDVVDRVVPFAANDDSPILFVSTRSNEHFRIDHRGSLIRIAGKPKGIGKGRDLAMKRIRATAALMGDQLLENNRHVPWGAESVQPETPTECVVRFG